MRIEITDERDETLLFLGFLSADDGENHLHCSLDIINNEVYFQDFMSGRIGEYRFQADRSFTDRGQHNGCLFIGCGRGRKPDVAIEAMKEFIHKIAYLDITLDEEHKVGDKYVYEI